MAVLLSFSTVQDSRFVHSAPIKRFFSHKFGIYAIYFLVKKQYNIVNLFNFREVFLRGGLYYETLRT